MTEGAAFRVFVVPLNVLPLDDRSVERINPDTAGRPTLVHGSSQVLFGDMGRLTEATVMNIKNKSHSVTADIQVPDIRRRRVLDPRAHLLGDERVATIGAHHDPRVCRATIAECHADDSIAVPEHVSDPRVLDQLRARGLQRPVKQYGVERLPPH